MGAGRENVACSQDTRGLHPPGLPREAQTAHLALPGRPAIRYRHSAARRPTDTQQGWLCSAIAINIGNVGRACTESGDPGAGSAAVRDRGSHRPWWRSTALAIPPILINASTGLEGGQQGRHRRGPRDGALGESEPGSAFQFRIAAPVIFAGIRTSAVQTVASATLATFIGGGGLGDLIVEGYSRRGPEILLAGAIVVAVLAIITEVGFGALERMFTPRGSKDRAEKRPLMGQVEKEERVKNRTKLIRAIPGAARGPRAAALAACGNVGRHRQPGTGRRGRPDDYGRLEGLYRAVQTWRALRPGARRQRVQRGDEAKSGLWAYSRQGLQNGQTTSPRVHGNGPRGHFKTTKGTRPTDTRTGLPGSQRKPTLTATRPNTMLEPAPFNNTYGIFVRREVAEEYNLRPYQNSPRPPRPHLHLFSQFLNRKDGVPNIRKTTRRLEFEEIKIVNNHRRPDLLRAYSRGEGDAGVGSKPTASSPPTSWW